MRGQSQHRPELDRWPLQNEQNYTCQMQHKYLYHAGTSSKPHARKGIHVKMTNVLLMQPNVTPRCWSQSGTVALRRRLFLGYPFTATMFSLTILTCAHDAMFLHVQLSSTILCSSVWFKVTCIGAAWQSRVVILPCNLAGRWHRCKADVAILIVLQFSSKGDGAAASFLSLNLCKAKDTLHHMATGNKCCSREVVLLLVSTASVPTRYDSMFATGPYVEIGQLREPSKQVILMVCVNAGQ